MKPLAPKKPDMVNHPPHYTQGTVECIDAMASALGPDGFISYLRGACIKYAWRMAHKATPLEDAKKLGWYAARLVKAMESM